METLQCWCFTFLLSFGHNVVCKKANDKREFVEIDTTRNTSFRLDKDLHPTSNLSTLLGPFLARKSLPKAYDWRTNYKFNVVPPAENQNPCYSCWIFGTLYMLEAQYAIKTGKIVSFSKQQLVDCHKGNNGLGGCKGWGTIQMAFDHVKYYGIMSTKAYGPYLGADGTCKYDPRKVIATAKDMMTITGHDAFLRVLYHRGPVGSIMISPGGGYNGGILSIKGDQCPEATRPPVHMVLIVGYGKTSKGLKYWIAKNTVGPNYGIEKGYFKIERGKNTLCIEKLGVIGKIVPKRRRRHRFNRNNYYLGHRLNRSNYSGHRFNRSNYLGHRFNRSN